MAYEKRGETLPGIAAGADLSSTGQHRFVDLDGSGEAVLAGAGAAVAGVLENAPAQGEAAAIMGPGSVSKVEAGAAVSAGADVTSDASGRAVTSASGNYIAGKAINAAGGAGELISVWICQPGRTA